MPDSTSSSITVLAPRPAVMAVIADFPAYPEWAGVKSAEVLAQEDGGRASRVRFQLDAGPIRDTYVLGYRWQQDEAVDWELAESGSVISAMTGRYGLADGNPGTVVSFDLTVGVRIPMPGILKRRAEKIIIDTALKGLRERAESGAGPSARGGDRQ